MRGIGRGVWSALAAASLLVACGGGSSPTAPQPTPTQQQVTALPARIAIDGPSSAEPALTTNWQVTDLPDGADLRYEWRFGDGSSAVSRNASHSFAAAGDYQVTLIVRNGAGDAVQASRTLHVAWATVASVDCSAAAGDGWCFQVPGTRPRAITEFAWAANGWGIGVGEAGTVVATTDGGQHWVLQPPSGAARMTGLRMLPDGQAWALSGGALVHSVDAGRAWQPVGPAPSSLYWVVDPQRLVANATPAPSPTPWASSYSTDGGRTWQPGTMMSLFAVGPTGVVMGWDGYGERALSFSHDLGRSVSSRLNCRIGGSCEVISYTLADERAFVVVTRELLPNLERGLVRYRSSDGGRNWESQALAQVPGTGPVLAGGGLAYSYARPPGSDRPRSEHLYRSTDDGLTWRSVGPDLWPADAVSAPTHDALDPATLWLARPGGATVSTDAGQSWRLLVVAGETAPPDALRRAADGQLVLGFGRINASGVPGPIQRWHATHDDGKSWNLLPGASFMGIGDRVVDLGFADSARGVLLYSDGRAATTDDGGRHWQVQAPSTAHLPAGRLRMAPDGSGSMLLGQRLYYSADGGRTWLSTTASAPPAPSLREGRFVDLDHGWGVFQQSRLDLATWVLHPGRSGVLLTEDGGRTSREVDVPGVVTAVLPLSSRSAIISRMTLGLFRTEDGGATWQPVGSVGGAGTDTETLPLASSDHDLWRVVGPQLLHSTDVGRTWRAVSAPPLAGYRLNGVAFGDALNGWIVGSAGLILRTTDGGHTWTAQPAPTGSDLVRVVGVGANSAWVINQDGHLLATAAAGQ